MHEVLWAQYLVSSQSMAGGIDEMKLAMSW